jgi:hypothetical protein
MVLNLIRRKLSVGCLNATLAAFFYVFFNTGVVAESSTALDVEEPVHVLSYVRAKTAIQFAKYQASAGDINRFSHRRDVIDVDYKGSKRVNRDTLYSGAIVDISKGASITLPDAGDRYMSVQVVNEHGFTNKVYHGRGRYHLTVDEFDTPYVWLLVRTLVFPSLKGDLNAVHKLQDKIQLHSASHKPYLPPKYEQSSFAKTTELLVQLTRGIPALDTGGAAGKIEEVDPVKQLLLAAYGFGTLPQRESFLISVEPNAPADGEYFLHIEDVPVDGFWSLAMYNKEGYFNPNKHGIYGYSDRTAKKNRDGSITLHFGGDPSKVNFIPLSEDWNYVVRLYRPNEVVLSGSWTFPQLQIVK